MTFVEKSAPGLRVVKMLLFLFGLFGVNAAAQAQADNLMITKYVDWDSGSGVAVVIWNPTPNAINLANYQLRIFGNGATTPSTTSNLIGTLQPCGTILVGNDEYKNTNCRNTVSTANFDAFTPGVNGNDVVALTFTTTANPAPTAPYQLIDAVGRIGFDPGNNNSQKVNNTTDALFQHTLTRTSSNVARYSLASGTYNANNLTSANIWPNNSSTNVLGWTVSSSQCITNSWSSPTANVNAGPDKNLTCKTLAPISLAGATATGTGVTVQWSGGKGTFSNPNSLTSTYTPSRLDFANIKLTLKATSGCQQVSDNLTIINGDSAEKAKALIYSPQAPLVGDTVTFALQTQVANKVIFGNFNYGDGTPNETKRLTAKHVYTKTGTFDVKVTTTNLLGCPLDTLLQRVVITDKPVITPVNVIIPNIFTPNGDTHNDTYHPQLPPTTSYELQVYNRWGSKIFESNSQDKEWDGKNTSDGVYYIYLKAEYISGEKINVKLPVTIVR